MGRAVLLIALLMALATFASLTPPKQATAQPNGGTNQQVEGANFVAPLNDPPEAGHYYKPCRKGENDRSSDLCAQWKAADAAKVAANASLYLGIIGGLIAAFTLGTAWLAAGWAKKAAIHTEDSVTEAKKGNTLAERIGIAQTRAYLSIVPTSFTYDENAGWFDFEFAATNSGQSPARKVSITTEMFYKKSAPYQGLQHMAVTPPMEIPGDIASGRSHVWKAGLDAFSGHPVLMLESGRRNLFTVQIKAAYDTIFQEVAGEDTFVFIAIIPPDGRDLRIHAKPTKGVVLQFGETRKRGEPAVVGIWHSPAHQDKKP